MDDLTRRRTPVRVVRVEEETIGEGKDAKDWWVVYFHGLTKGLVLNATNARMLAEGAARANTKRQAGGFCWIRVWEIGSFQEEGE